MLDLTHDPHALPAIRAYAESCQHPFPYLARDLRRIVADRSQPCPTPDKQFDLREVLTGIMPRSPSDQPARIVLRSPFGDQPARLVGCPRCHTCEMLYLDLVLGTAKHPCGWSGAVEDIWEPLAGAKA